MRKYGLLGFPLGHSFSKRYFTDKFMREDIDATFINIEEKNLDNIFQAVNNISDLKGFSVTIPHKKDIIPLLHEIDAQAKVINAVNCVKVLPDGSWKGYNTDCVGFKESIKPLLKPAHQKALILGTGGAAEAVAWGLDELNVTYQRVSRTEKGNLTYEDLNEEIISQNKVIINCTPIGMHPYVDECPNIDYEALSSSHLLYDLIYNPVLTMFLKKGKEKGTMIKNGQEMLELQAAAAWHIWNKRDE